MRKPRQRGERFDLVVVGLGSAGLAAARFAANLGLRVAAVEQGPIGGDCLWTGCVPSKGLIASARAAQGIRTAGTFGVEAGQPIVDGAAVFARIRAIQRDIADGPDSPAELARAGVTHITGTARLDSRTSVVVGERRIVAKYVLICAGSRPAVPPIPGLEETGYLTSDTVWDLTVIPKRLAIIGAGAIGCELGQAFARLGSQVTILEAAPHILALEDPALTDLLTSSLTNDGVSLVTGATIDRIEPAGGARVIHGQVGADHTTWTADAILVATGRVANTPGLGLEAQGIAVGPGGVEVDDHMRTNCGTVFAAGDVTARPRFTHVAAHDATIAVRNMFFPGSSEVPQVVPRCVFTDPELASVGLTVAQAQERHGAAAVRVHRTDLTRGDRGRTDGLYSGAIQLVTVKGRLAGAGVLAPAAGEIVQSLALAIAQRMRLRDLASVVHIYPTHSWEIALLASQASYEHARRLRWLTRLRLPRRPND